MNSGKGPGAKADKWESQGMKLYRDGREAATSACRGGPEPAPLIAPVTLSCHPTRRALVIQCTRQESLEAG